MGPTSEDPPLEAVLVQIGGVLLNEVTVDRVLELVTELTARTVSSAAAVSVTLERDKRPFTPHASDDVARQLDDVQYDTNAGPCLDALTQHHPVSGVFDGSRWPAFEAAAIEAGMKSVLSLPLVAGDKSLGALNLYSRSSDSFDETEQTTASLLAQQGAAVLANAVAFTDAAMLNEQLMTALETRDLIGQAKGILMIRESCDADAAFDVLRRASQRLNQKLRDVAAAVVLSAAKPESE
jgi:transcriptional regulator with GAF, ATPase, and Fis domain